MTRARVHWIVAVAPVALSLLALALVTAAIGLGWDRGLHDEGAVAHTWRLLIAAQAPLVAAFLLTADWRHAGREIRTLAFQAGALAVALAPVAILRL